MYLRVCIFGIIAYTLISIFFNYNIIHLTSYTHSSELCLVITLYNVEKYSQKLKNSIDYENTHTVIVDDNSQDKSASPFVNASKLVDVTPMISSYAANWGLYQCPQSTKYVSFIDGDDWLELGYARKMIKVLKETSADVVISKYNAWSRDGLVRENIFRSEHWFWNSECASRKIIDVHKMNNCTRLLAHINPIPGRRVYKKEKVIEFTEGIARFEDNVQWWQTLYYVNNIAIINESLYNHRRSRSIKNKESTVEMMWHFKHLAHIINNNVSLSLYFKEWLLKIKWPFLHQKNTRSIRILRENMNSIFTGNTVSLYDLTLVIPCFNVIQWVEHLISQCTQLVSTGYEYEKRIQIIFIDGSSDNTGGMLRRYTDTNVDTHLIRYLNDDSPHAGRLRNYAMPFVQGRWTMFFDADDILIPNVIIDALIRGDVERTDIVFFQYYREIEYKHDAWKRERMFKPDLRIWDFLKSNSSTEDKWLKTLDFINYPWTRIVRTKQLFEKQIHFGINHLHNDVCFHWLSLFFTLNNSYIPAPGVIHRYHNNHNQLTYQKTLSRESIHSDLRLLHRRMTIQSQLQPQWKRVKPHFSKFVVGILHWIDTTFDIASIGFDNETLFTKSCILSDFKFSCISHVTLHHTLTFDRV